jgi:hypothetical protein
VINIDVVASFVSIQWIKQLSLTLGPRALQSVDPQRYLASNRWPYICVKHWEPQRPRFIRSSWFAAFLCSRNVIKLGVSLHFRTNPSTFNSSCVSNAINIPQFHLSREIRIWSASPEHQRTHKTIWSGWSTFTAPNSSLQTPPATLSPQAHHFGAQAGSVQLGLEIPQLRRLVIGLVSPGFFGVLYWDVMGSKWINEYNGL